MTQLTLKFTENSYFVDCSTGDRNSFASQDANKCNNLEDPEDAGYLRQDNMRRDYFRLRGCNNDIDIVMTRAWGGMFRF